MFRFQASVATNGSLPSSFPKRGSAIMRGNDEGKKKIAKKKVEEEKVRMKSNPGFFRDGLIFEQVEGLKYAHGETVDLLDQYHFIGEDCDYQPLLRCPWPLATKPIEYGSSKELWNDVRQFIYEHLFLPSEALYGVLTAWIMSTWIRELWTVVPYLFFYGPVASGKTRGLEVLHRICYRGILAGNISAAALFRSCELWHPTLLLDETEIYSRETKIEVVGLLNSGYRRGQYAIRVKQTQYGTELETFDVFGHKALAGTHALAQALESRAIMVRMIKARRSVNRLIDEKKATELRNKLLGWRLYTLACAELSELYELFTEGIPPLDFADGRLIELFTCLLAVSNEGRENILKYAKKMFELRQFEEKASEEAEIVEILLKENLANEKNIVLTKEVAESFNASRLDKEKWKTKSVGWILRRLGFNKVHTEKGNGWLIEEDRLAYLQQIYSVDTPIPEKVQDIQKVQPKIEEMFPKDKPQRQMTTQEILTLLKIAWQKGPYAEFDALLMEIRSCSREDAERLREMWIDEGLLAYDPQGLLTWVKGGS